MQSDFDRAKIMLSECNFRACMNACTCGLCSSVRRAIKDLRLYAISFYLSVSCLCTGHSILATFRVCIYACRFLDFRVRRFDNKLQVAFDSVICWLVEVLLTS